MRYKARTNVTKNTSSTLTVGESTTKQLNTENINSSFSTIHVSTPELKKTEEPKVSMVLQQPAQQLDRRQAQLPVENNRSNWNSLNVIMTKEYT